MKFFLNACVAVLFFSSVAWPDTVILKNGRRIENVAAWEADGQIKYLRFGAVVGHPLNKVARVEAGPVKEEAVPAGSETKFLSGNSGKIPEPEVPPSASSFTVLKVSDGDTFRAGNGSIEIRVRIAGIDAPETEKPRSHKPGQPYAEEAKKFLEQMILDRKVRIQGYGIGPYNRQIARVFAGRKDAGLALVRAGLAEVYTGRPPDGLDMSVYRQAQSEAQRAGRGMWSQGNNYISPARWRKMAGKK